MTAYGTYHLIARVTGLDDAFETTYTLYLSEVLVVAFMWIAPLGMLLVARRRCKPLES